MKKITVATEIPYKEIWVVTILDRNDNSVERLVFEKEPSEEIAVSAFFDYCRKNELCFKDYHAIVNKGYRF